MADEKIYIVRGDTFVLPFTWLDLSRDPVDLSDKTITAVLSWTGGEIELSDGDGILISAPAEGSGVLQIAEDHAQNGAVPLGESSFLTVISETDFGYRQTIARVPVVGSLGPNAILSKAGRRITSRAHEQSLRIKCDPVEATSGIVLTGSRTMPEGTAQGSIDLGTFTVVGVIGTPVYTLEDNAGGTLQVVGDKLQPGAVPSDFEDDPTLQGRVAVSGVTPSAPPITFTVSITDVSEGGGGGDDDDYAAWSVAA